MYNVPYKVNPVHHERTRDIKPMDLSKFHVVTVISNPARFRTRYDLYRRFQKHVEDAGVQLTVVEMSFGDRPVEIEHTPWSDKTRIVRVSSFSELWHKENMINLGIASLPSDWEYVAWIDADILFVRPDWAMETMHQLQHYMVVQMFSHAYDLGPEYQVLQAHNSYMWSYHENEFQPPQGAGYGGYYGYDRRGFWHPGYAWAARREAIDFLGGLIDWAILGAGDHHMAHALIGAVKRSMPKGISPAYLRELLEWEERALKFIQKDIGYVPGTINHYWHGKKKNRKYKERWDIITKNNYDPDTDLKKDWQGLWQLADNKPKLRDDIRAYFRARSEDSIDVE